MRKHFTAFIFGLYAPTDKALETTKNGQLISEYFPPDVFFLQFSRSSEDTTY